MRITICSDVPAEEYNPPVQLVRDMSSAGISWVIVSDDSSMAISDADERLLQSIAAAKANINLLLIATDYPAELADEMREPQAETYEPTAQESEWLGTQIALMYGVCDLTIEQIDVEEWQKETEATRKTDYPI